MDALNAVLPPSGQTLAVTVNGRPLAEVLTAVGNALRAQQEEFRAFKAQQRSESDVVNRRLQQLEDRALRIETDLNIAARPVTAYGQAPMAVLYDAVTTMEYRLFRAQGVGRERAAAAIRQRSDRGVLSRYLRAWLLFRHRRAGALRRQQQNQCVLYGRYFGRWLQSVAALRKEMRQRRHVQSLLYSSAKALAGRYMGTWRRWREDLNARMHEKALRDAAVADQLAAIALRGLVRRYFHKWATYSEHLAFNAGRYRDAQRLEVAAHQHTAREAFGRWAAFTDYRLFEIRRRRAIHTRHKQALRVLVLRYLLVWRQFVGVRREQHTKLGGVSRMHHRAMVTLASRYFMKIVGFVVHRRQERRIDDLAAFVSLLGRKYDSLGDQLDASVDNLSHTNTVLGRVVDAVVLANPDAPEVQSLLNTGGRRLYAGRVARDEAPQRLPARHQDDALPAKQRTQQFPRRGPSPPSKLENAEARVLSAREVMAARTLPAAPR